MSASDINTLTKISYSAWTQPVQGHVTKLEMMYGIGLYTYLDEAAIDRMFIMLDTDNGKPDGLDHDLIGEMRYDRKDGMWTIYVAWADGGVFYTDTAISERVFTRFVAELGPT